MSRELKGARCEENQDIYEKIKRMKVVADLKKNTNASFSYKKVLKTLEKYPIPIISVKQAVTLDGVGIKMVSLINDIVSSRYGVYKRKPVSPSQPDSRPHSKSKLTEANRNQSVSETKSFSLKENLNKIGFMPLKKIHQNFSVDSTRSLNLSTRARAKGSKNSEKCTLLLTTLLLCQQDSQFRKFFTKDEINDFLVDNPLYLVNTKAKIPGQIFQSLLQQNLISKLDFDTEIKYSLTQEGYKLAERYLKDEKEFSAKKNTLKFEALKTSRDTKEVKETEWSLQEKPLADGAAGSDFEVSHEELSQILTKPVRDSNDLPQYEFSYQGLFNSQSNCLSLASDIFINAASNPARIVAEGSLLQKVQSSSGLSLSNKLKLSKKVQMLSADKPLTFFTNNITQRKLILYVDNREKGPNRDNIYFAEKLQMGGIDIVTRNLSLGDFLWGLEIVTVQGETFTLALDYIIERKTIDDLAASIFDGRYKDQKRRLKNSKIDNVFYLIEGDLSQNGFPGLKTAINSTRIAEKFKVVRTDSPRSSKIFLSKLHFHIQDKIDQQFKNSMVEFKFHFEDFLKSQQKFTNLTVKNALLNALRQIKGFGPETTYQLLPLFPTMTSLYANINDRASEETSDIVLTKMLNKNQKQDLLTLFKSNNYW